VKRLRVLVWNLSGTGCCNMSKMAAQSYSPRINQQKCVSLFQYSEWLSTILAKRLGYFLIFPLFEYFNLSPLSPWTMLVVRSHGCVTYILQSKKDFNIVQGERGKTAGCTPDFLHCIVLPSLLSRTNRKQANLSVTALLTS